MRNTILRLAIMLLFFGSITQPMEVEAAYIPTNGQVNWGLNPAFSDSGVASQATGNINGYYQSIWQNTSNGTSASADVVVNNNLGSSTAYFGDFGINSSTFTGSGSFNLPNASYLASSNGDLVIGTFTNNAIHFVINSGNTDAGGYDTTGNYVYHNQLLISPVVPTISSGFGTSPSVTSGNSTAAFRVNVGTGGVATTGVVGLSTATNGWNCYSSDITTPATNVTVQTASTTTSASFANYARTTGLSAAWTASDVLAISCFAY